MDSGITDPNVASFILFYRKIGEERVAFHLELDSEGTFIRETQIGSTEMDYEVQIGLGDFVTDALKPVVRTVDSVLHTSLEDCAGCKRRAHGLNEFGEATGINKIIRKLVK